MPDAPGVVNVPIAKPRPVAQDKLCRRSGGDFAGSNGFEHWGGIRRLRISPGMLNRVALVSPSHQITVAPGIPTRRSNGRIKSISPVRRAMTEIHIFYVHNQRPNWFRYQDAARNSLVPR